MRELQKGARNNLFKKKPLSRFTAGVCSIFLSRREVAHVLRFSFIRQLIRERRVSSGWIYRGKYRSRGRGRFIVPLSFVSPVFHYLNYESNSVRVQKVHTTWCYRASGEQKTRLRRLSRNNFYVRNGAARARRFLPEKWQASLENSDKKAALFYSHQCFPCRTLTCTFVGRHGTPRAISVGDHSKFFSPAALDVTST